MRWRLLLPPTPDIPLRCCPLPLQAWVHEFFKFARLAHPDRQMTVVQKPFYFPFSRTNTTVHITWSYGPEMTFRPAPGTSDSDPGDF